jgi:hypothetical protein
VETHSVKIGCERVEMKAQFGAESARCIGLFMGEVDKELSLP